MFGGTIFTKNSTVVGRVGSKYASRLNVLFLPSTEGFDPEVYLETTRTSTVEFLSEYLRTIL